MNELTLAKLTSQEQSPAELLADFESLIRGADVTLRRRAARWAQAAVRPVDLLEPLQQCLADDPVWSVREAAAESIGQIAAACESQQTSTALTRKLLHYALMDSSEFVREMCRQQLVHCNDDWPGTFSTLEDTWTSERIHLRRRALNAFSDFSIQRDPAPPLTTAIEDSHWKLRSTGLIELRKHPAICVRQIGIVARRCFDCHSSVAFQARETVSQLQEAFPRAVVDGLTGSVGDRGPSAALSFLLEHPDLQQEHHTRFQAACDRRLRWHQRPADPETQTSRSSTDCAQRCVAAARSKKQPARNAHRESAWLTGAMCEILCSDQNH